jgi:hypothetical protein
MDNVLLLYLILSNGIYYAALCYSGITITGLIAMGCAIAYTALRDKVRPKTWIITERGFEPYE